MSPVNRWILLGFLAAGVFPGCSGDKGARRDDASAGGALGPRKAEPIRPERSRDEQVTEMDVNGDHSPDVWTYSVTVKSPDGRERERVVRKELDLNWDGKVDLTQYFDEHGEKVREVMDLDYDGKVDATYTFEKGLKVKGERDIDGDGRPDSFLFFEKGVLVRKENDNNHDGRVDYWEYWEGNQVDRIGEDVDGDGNVDKWTRNPSAARQ
ncbi:hypothetical protein KRR26_15550 [Corallococcus sp. M34]|nr:hypothetical protein [Citreicoccus inhibens]